MSLRVLEPNTDYQNITQFFVSCKHDDDHKIDMRRQLLVIDAPLFDTAIMTSGYNYAVIDPINTRHLA